LNLAIVLLLAGLIGFKPLELDKPFSLHLASSRLTRKARYFVGGLICTVGGLILGAPFFGLPCPGASIGSVDGGGGADVAGISSAAGGGGGGGGGAPPVLGSAEGVGGCSGMALTPYDPARWLRCLRRARRLLCCCRPAAAIPSGLSAGLLFAFSARTAPSRLKTNNNERTIISLLFIITDFLSFCLLTSVF
jgi:hypothetical protein